MKLYIRSHTGENIEACKSPDGASYTVSIPGDFCGVVYESTLPEDYGVETTIPMYSTTWAFEQIRLGKVVTADIIPVKLSTYKGLANALADYPATAALDFLGWKLHEPSEAEDCNLRFAVGDLVVWSENPDARQFRVVDVSTEMEYKPMYLLAHRNDAYAPGIWITDVWTSGEDFIKVGHMHDPGR